jgi:hypothetical protein
VATPLITDFEAQLRMLLQRPAAGNPQVEQRLVSGQVLRGLEVIEKAAPDEPVWGQALGCFYGGQGDEATLAALVRWDAAPD